MNRILILCGLGVIFSWFLPQLLLFQRENFEETSGTKNFQKVSEKVTMEVTNQEKVTPGKIHFTMEGREHIDQNEVSVLVSWAIKSCGKGVSRCII